MGGFHLDQEEEDAVAPVGGKKETEDSSWSSHPHVQAQEHRRSKRLTFLQLAIFLYLDRRHFNLLIGNNQLRTESGFFGVLRINFLVFNMYKAINDKRVYWHLYLYLYYYYYF